MGESNKHRLAWVKWSVEDADICRNALENRQMGELFFAVMHYAGTGERPKVSPDIQFAFDMFAANVDSFRTAYKKTCEERAENGAKGGRKKAENAKSKKVENTTFTPPTKTEFRNMAKHYKSMEEAEFDDFDLYQFYADLVSSDWTIDGVRIKSQDALEAAFFARFYTYNKWSNTWEHFKRVFSLSGGDLEIWDRFEDCFNEDRGSWEVDGTTYNNGSDAVLAILASASHSSKC